MITRRGLLQVGVTLAASPAVLADARHTAGERSMPLCAAVIDARSLDAQAFAQAVAARGLPTHAIRADLADVYYGQLAPRWRQGGPAAVGGLTHASPLFYLERLAWDADMRLVFLGRHEIGKDTQPRHALEGPRATIDAFRDSARLLDWRIALAHALSRILEPAPALSLSAVRDAVVARDEALFSWVLAPITRRHRSARPQVFR